MWPQSMSKKKIHRLEDNAFKRIMDDLKAKPDAYTGAQASVGMKTPDRINPLHLPDRPDEPNESLIRELAVMCAPWSFDRHRRLARMDIHLAVVKATSFSERHVSSPINRSWALQNVSSLRKMIHRKDDSLAAWRIYLASRVLMDTLRFSQPPEDCKMFAKSLTSIMRASYKNLRWSIDQKRGAKEQRQDFSHSLYTLLIELWRGKKPSPDKVCYFHTTYRIGLLFGIEKPFDETDPGCIPTDSEVRNRFDKRLNRKSTNEKEEPDPEPDPDPDSRPIQKFLLIGDEEYSRQEVENMKNSRARTLTGMKSKKKLRR